MVEVSDLVVVDVMVMGFKLELEQGAMLDLEQGVTEELGLGGRQVQEVPAIFSPPGYVFGLAIV